MNNNQTTAEKTTTETVTSPTADTTTTTTTTTTEVTSTTTTGTTSTNEEGDGGAIATAETESVYNGVTDSGPFVLGETFTATDSTLTIESGDTFTANKVTSSISLSNNKITNSDVASALLRATESNITLKLVNQVAEGDIILDNLSTLNLVLSSSSYYMGVINSGNTAKSVSVTLDAGSQLILAGDTYVTTLTNAEPTNMNIYSNGYKLYVAGAEVAINGSKAPEAPEVKVKEEEIKEVIDIATTDTVTNKSTTAKTDYTPFIVGGAAILVIILAIVVFIIHNKKKNTPTGTVMGAPDATGPAPMDGARPDFSQFDDGPVAQPQTPQMPTPPQGQDSTGQNLEGFSKQ